MFVFRMVLFVVVLKCLVSFVYSASTPLPEIPNDSKEGQTLISTKSNNATSVNKTQDIGTVIGEGGEKLMPITPSNVTNVKTNTTEQSDINKNTPIDVTAVRGREGELINTEQKKNNFTNNTKGEDENFDRTHKGREGELVQDKHTATSKTADITSTTMSDSTNKVSTASSAITDNMESSTTHSPVVGRKGVNFTDTVISDVNMTSTVSTNVEVSSTTIKSTVLPSIQPEKVHKPTVTTGSEAKGDALVKQKSNNSTPKVPTIEYYQNKKEEDNKRSNFIIPIVAVIFSVPIVAIILNITYKRCKEWWSHRHYSRMDFLIDGMYNN